MSTGPSRVALAAAALAVAGCAGPHRAANPGALSPRPPSVVSSPSPSPSPSPSGPVAASASPASPAPSGAATESPPSPSPPLPSPRFKAAAGVCLPAQKPAIAGDWQVSAPRSTRGPAAPAGKPVQIGLRAQPGSGAPSASTVQARVIGPDGTASAPATLNAVLEGDWGYLMYPTDFPAAPADYPAGTYTVIWTRVPSGAFLACDGWLAG